jgi:hypothetical protein
MMKIIIIAAAVLFILFTLVGRASRRGDEAHPREGADGNSNDDASDSPGHGDSDAGGD